MGKFAVTALRIVLVIVILGTVLVQSLMVVTLITGDDPEDGRLPLNALRVVVILGILAIQVALVCIWRLLSMVRRGTVFSPAAFRDVDIMTGAIVAVAIAWFAMTALDASGQRDDPGVTVIMCGIGVGILGVALLVVVMRALLAQAVEREIEAKRLRAELDEVI